jgi:uncharacterized membrane protein YbaN (DUF454 family)
VGFGFQEIIMNLRTARSTVHRALFGALGAISVALAFVGVFVPGLPTTVFVITASYLFARSSPTLDSWLRRNRWFGPTLRHFAEGMGMPLKSKVIALTSMWVGLTISWYSLVDMGMVVRMMAISCGIAGTVTLLFYVRTTQPE